VKFIYKPVIKRKKKKVIMNKDPAHILTMNGGSSSIKFAFYKADKIPTRLLHGKIDGIGLKESTLTFSNENGNQENALKAEASDHRSAANFLMDWLEKQHEFSSVVAVGHRVVHGMEHSEPELITPELLSELHRIIPYDPDHLPEEIKIIETLRQRHPKLPQIACFDTAFHSTMPRVAKLLPIPRRFDTMGIRRFGFHGLSYSYLMEELTRIEGSKTARGRVILAHLGSGASMAAVHEGHSIDTTMALTPAAGLMMSTRSGDIDPGLISFLARREQMTALQFDEMVNHKSGLLGVSETSADMKELLLREDGDIRASEAVALFCYEAKKRIGAYSAALGGLDILIFTGGIGENSRVVRSRICEGLGFLGIKINESLNVKNALLISTETSRVKVYVFRTDEEFMIARSVCRILEKIKLKQR
jgi:acetate kinase